MFDPVLTTGAIERVAAEPGGRTGSVLWQIGELDAIVGEHDLDSVGHGGDKGLQEGARGLRIGLVDELSDCELGGAVGLDEEIEFALRRRLHFGDIDVEEADRIDLAWVTRCTSRRGVRPESLSVLQSGLKNVEALICDASAHGV